MFVFLYTAGVACYHAAIRLISPFHAKAAAWLEGRRGLWEKIERFERGEGKVAWVHVASLGEFEQGRPLVEMIRERLPGTRVVLTFFSPSGHEACKRYGGADAVFYLPPESPGNARRFVHLVRPDAAIFVKYEFWYHYLHALHVARVPTYLISARFRPGQPFFRPWGVLHRRMLALFTGIRVQEEESARLLRSVGISRVEVTGDTRFDRVLAIAGQARPVERVERLRGEGPLIVCGSTWPADEEIICRYMRGRGRGCRWVIVPHEVGEARARALVERCGEGTGRLSGDALEESTCRVLVVDRVGLLSSIYRYATVAYVGGGFGRGIHNTLEAAVYGIPVVFGPAYRKFGEAVELVRRGGGFSIRDAEGFAALMESLLSRPGRIARAGQRAKALVEEGAGATEKTFNMIRGDLS
ncbi:MAG: 3-deoxy-D-manno-octulosonic acid transferase [Odoribacteraceae bacterium]|jgi:3-deoxy-D-manno-octulosonic-acid transferase|nr:3-deoxy-D-manno-octulosonic acid transferase [Odoribacteraceae bacterium]